MPAMGSSKVGQQIRYTLRKLRRAPFYTLLSVGLLGLGLGVVAATYTVLNQVVLRPLPVTDQDKIVVAWTNHTVRGFDHFPVVAPLFEAAESGGIPALAAVGAVSSYGTGRVVVDGSDGPINLGSARVLGDFFGVLGVEPSLGRVLLPSDDVPNPRDLVAVISHRLWMQTYGGSADVLGQLIRTRFGTYTVVGVMPAEFDYPRGADFWSPTRPGYPRWASELPLLELDLVGRVGPNATPAMVAPQLAALTLSTPELRELYEGAVPVVRSFEEHVLGDLSPTLIVLFVGGLLVLVVASLDLANIVLIRAVGERQQTAVRRALGMDPRWVLNEAAIEAAFLAVAATGVGLVLGNVGVGLLVPFAPTDLPRLDLVRHLDPSAYFLVALGALLAVTAAVALPRWRIGRLQSDQPLLRSNTGASTRGSHLLREAVVAGQVAIAVWVLVTGALLVRTVVNLQSLEAGFDPDNLAVVALDRSAAGVQEEPGEDPLLAAAVRRIERSNGVLGATPIQMAPLPGNGAWQTLLFKEGQSREQAREENPFVFMEFVEPDFTSILDVPVLRGRFFGETDRADAPLVLVVNEAAARLYWPAQEAVGQVVSGLPGRQGEAASVIGVIGDTRYGDLTELKPTAYFPRLQSGAFGAQYILVRTLGPGPPLLNLVRESLRLEAPQYRAVDLSFVKDRLDEPLVRPRFAALLLAVLALTALLIAVAGVYSTMAFLVRTRRRELGIRMACGGAPRSVGGMIVRRGLEIALLGSVLGAATAMMSSRLFSSLLFGVATVDAPSLLAGIGLALACATLACLAPALRAASTNPATVLRSDEV